MKIYPHWLHMSGIITEADVPNISECLNIPPTLWESFIKASGTQIFALKTPDNTEIASIMILPSGKHGSVLLRGDWFDRYPDQSIKSLCDLMYQKAGNCLRLDNSFKDFDGILDFEEIKRLSHRDNFRDFLKGSATEDRKKKKRDKNPDSTNRGGIPDIHDNHRWIQYGDSDSTSSAKFYTCADGHNKFEITQTNKVQTEILLSAYDPVDMTKYNELAKSALVKTIDFVSAASKRAKRPVQLPFWKKFLGGKVVPIKWVTHCPDKQDLTLLDSFLIWKSGLYQTLYRGIERFNLQYFDVEAIAAEIETRLMLPE